VGTTVNFNNVTLGSPSSFSWSFGDGTPGSTLLNPTHVYTDTGSYLVSLTAANPGGIVTFSHYLKVHGNPSASGEITNATGLTATDGAVVITVTGGTAPYTFLWSTGGNHDTLSAVAPGTYEVTVTDTNSCVVAETFVVSYSNNVRDLSDDVQLKIYPNPANDVLFVQSGNSAIIKLEVVNVMGQTVLVNNGSGNFYRLQTHVLAPGNYLLLVHTDGGVARRMFTVVRE
jgi:PKD repeat protein